MSCPFAIIGVFPWFRRVSRIRNATSFRLYRSYYQDQDFISVGNLMINMINLRALECREKPIKCPPDVCMRVGSGNEDVNDTDSQSKKHTRAVCLWMPNAPPSSRKCHFSHVTSALFCLMFGTSNHQQKQCRIHYWFAPMIITTTNVDKPFSCVYNAID